MSLVENALAAAGETKALRTGRGILNQVPELLREQFPGKEAVIIADGTTFHVAGEKVFEFIKASGISQKSPFIFNDPDLHAEYQHVERLTSFLKAHEAVAVAVGSGTINDLTKLSSHLAGRSYMCVATAASMDGYTSFGASITVDGVKTSIDCPAPRASLADIDIISHAPPEMTASGYADLFAKVTAGADWILADAMGEEAIDNTGWSIVQDGLADALSDPEGAAKGDPLVITKLIEGLMLGGFAMQWTRTSRPAAGAEHQFSHLWDMEHVTKDGKHFSHGHQVGIGMLAVTAFFEQVLKTPLENLDVEACCNSWPLPAKLEEQAARMFSGTPYPYIGVQETKEKYITREKLAIQLNKLKKDWPDIRSRLLKQIIPFSEVKRRLFLAGAPVEPEDIGVPRRHLRDSFLKAQMIRRRFTVLDLAVRTGNLDHWLDGIFSATGVWGINNERK
jgi:glycerol-1-phosphate dehydrogenase [NAD(P)+]